MEILSAEPILAATKGRPKGAVAVIRERHHNTARYIADGMPLAEIGRLVGMTGAGVKAWADNPANAELIAQYTEEAKARVTNFLETRTALRNEAALLAMELIVEQLREARSTDAKIGLDKLVRVVADCDDRTGLGRQETRVNINADLGTRLDKAVEAKRKAGEVRVGAFGAAGQSNVVELRRG
jgi:hypothetical protein